VAETAIGLVTGDRVSSVGATTSSRSGGRSRLTVDGASSTGSPAARLTVRRRGAAATGQLTETVGGRARHRWAATTTMRIGGSRSAIIGGSDATSIGSDAQTGVDGGLYAALARAHRHGR
jgi:hypothetical protein